MDIPSKVRRILPGTICDDAPFRGAHDVTLSRATAGYVLRCCGSSAHYHYPYIGCAPLATITGYGSWTSFTHTGDDDCTYEVPWFHQTQQQQIIAIVRIITASRASVLVRLQSDDLVDAVATTSSKGVRCGATERSGFLYWRNTHYFNGTEYPARDLRVGTAKVVLEDPTLPANRRISIKPQIKLTGMVDVLVGVAGDPRFWLESMILFDRPDPDTNG